jgi:hypothetical protein
MFTSFGTPFGSGRELNWLGLLPSVGPAAGAVLTVSAVRFANACTKR